MSLETLRPSPAFKDVLPVEYKDLVEHGPYNNRKGCLLYTSPSPRDATLSRMPSSA